MLPFQYTYSALQVPSASHQTPITAGQAVKLVKHNGKIVNLFEVDVYLSSYLF
jgi:hypothetical protein